MTPVDPRFLRRLVLVGAIALATAPLPALVAETQLVAELLRAPKPLPGPAVRLADYTVYAPWSVFAWRGPFAREGKRVFPMGEAARWFTALLWVVLPVGFLVRFGRRRSYDDAHGTAHWGTGRDLRERGLLSDEGIVLCQTHDAAVTPLRGGGFKQRRAGRLIRDASGLHTFVYAPSGSGKGVAICVPTLLSYTESVCVWDTKRELWQLTAGWRSQFSSCKRFDPTSPDSHRYNPLAEVRRGTDFEIRDVQAIAEMLADPEGKGGDDSGGNNMRHFQLAAQKLLETLLLHILYADAAPSLPAVCRFISQPNKTSFQLLEDLAAAKHVGGQCHPAVAAGAREMKNKTEEELSGIFSVAAVALGPYGSDPLLARAVSGTDFRIRDLLHAAQPTSLYLVSPPSDLTRLRPVMRLLLNQIGRRLTEQNASGGGDRPRHKLLFLLDEFPTLGRMPLFSEGIAYFRGYSLKLLLIAQSAKQLTQIYGANNSIVDNCDIRLTYHANDPETAKYVSEALGTRTYQRTSESVSSSTTSKLGEKQTSVSSQDHGRPLLTPDEVLRLPRDEAILFGGGAAPYRAKKVIYYDDPRFKQRATIPPPPGSSAS